MDESALEFVGKSLGGSRIVAVIGGGGMGTVFRAVQDRLKAPVAIKVIRPEFAANKDVVARFEREAHEIARIRGKTAHVVQIYDFGRDDDTGVYFIVMELVEGEGLDKILRRIGRFRESDALRIGRQAAAGLEAARLHGLIHRDIKPANLLLAPGGIVKITDFGLARGQEEADTAQVTRSGQVFGTVAYMSPQQAEGLTVDHRNDVYSLGATLYALVTGEQAYKGASPIAVLMATIHAPVPDPREHGADISEEFSAAIRKMMAKGYDERTQTAGEVARELDALLALDPAEAARSDNQALAYLCETSTDGETMLFDHTPPTIAPTGSAVRRAARRRRRGLLYFVGTAVVLAGGAGAFFVTRGGFGSPGAGPAGGSGPGPKPAAALRLLPDEPEPGSLLATSEVRVRGRLEGPEGGVWVRVNGKDAAITRDRYALTLPLPEGRHEIRIEAGAGAPGSPAADSVAVPVTVDLGPPALEVEGPLGGVTREAKVAVSGVATDPTLRSVRVRGAAVPLDAGKFRAEVPLDEGKNRVEVVAEDAAGRTTTRALEILRDTTAPEVVLESGERAESESAEFEVAGSARDATLASLSVGGAEVAPGSGGAFRRRVTLRPGENPILVRATDRAGLEASRTLTVVYRPLPDGLETGREAGVYRSVRDGAEMVRVENASGVLYVDRDEVTVGRYSQFLAALTASAEAGRPPHELCDPREPGAKDHSPLSWQRQTIPGRERHPVVGVDWWDAVAYARWARKELPTSDEWTAAAGGAAQAGGDGGTRAFPWGDSPPVPAVAVFGRRASGRQAGPEPAGGRPGGAAPCGARDLAGNVAEWCADAGAEPDSRLVRGGSWADAAEGLALAAPPRAESAGDRILTVGFRCLIRPRTGGSKGGDK
ncbi:MAG: bifunctional serine/threonine-protein kinase/formylglycine-generating enzyme family protein [Planctomycetales bacterium]|nr:bifunctional serine/threonine-protein kinase/formylglycine-generating enzyme family protein [Planctomycetales bacterium]